MGLASQIAGRRQRERADKGDRAEARVLRLALRMQRRCWWVLSVQRTAHHGPQDKLGWDLIVQTVDVGRIILQVKSCEAQARAFEARGRQFRLVAPIHVVVAEESTDDATLLGRVMGTCFLAREQALGAGLTADDPRLLERSAA